MGNDYTRGFLIPLIEAANQQQVAAAQPGYFSPLAAILQANMAAATPPTNTGTGVPNMVSQADIAKR